MNSSNLIDIFKKGDIVIPTFFLKNYKSMGLELDEFIFLMYLKSNSNSMTFDPEKISEDFGLELMEIMQIVGNLTEKDFISVEAKKNDKGYMEDVILLDGFYNKVKLLLVKEISNKKSEDVNNSSIYEYIEKEFARTLSSIEYEIIRAWLENNISEELIKEAVKEAVFNGVSNLKYIDKILYEWDKNGIKTVEDVENNRKKRQSMKDKSNINDNYSNDYQLLISIVLSAQTTDKRVNSVTSVLFSRYHDLFSLKNAKINDLETILRPIGSFRKKAIYVKEISRILNEDYCDVVPKDRDLLIKLPGVGRKTINVFFSEFYNIPAIAVDTHVERISKRLRLAYKSDDVLTIEKKLMRKLPKDEWGRRHLQLVLFGRYYCKAINPECKNCRIRDICIEKKKNL